MGNCEAFLQCGIAAKQLDRLFRWEQFIFNSHSLAYTEPDQLDIFSSTQWDHFCFFVSVVIIQCFEDIKERFI